MPSVTINIPDYWLLWIDQRKIDYNLRSRHAALQFAIQKGFGIPSKKDIEVSAVDVTKDWPVVDLRFVCIPCKDGSEHCGGGQRLLSNDHDKKEKNRWMCVCPTCALVASEATPDA